MTPRSPITIAAEVALVALSIAVIGGFSRLFVDGSYFWRLVAVSLAAHLLAIAVRRLGRGVALSAIVSVVGFGVVTSLVFYASTSRFGLPTTTTQTAIADDLRAAWAIFGDERAPVSAEVGFLFASAAALWVSAFLSDWAAFRLVSPVEAVAPPAVIFVFVSLFAAEQHQLVSTAIFVTALLAFFLTHRVARHDAGASWLGGTPLSGNGSLLRSGLMLGGVAVAAALLVGPSLPGANADAVLDIRELDDGPGSRFAVSPLVDIQSRLVDLPDTIMMTVHATTADYWRLTSLDDFDGRRWTSSGRFSDADGPLDSQLPAGFDQQIVRQDFTIVGLNQIWLPAAYEPTRVIDDGGATIQYESQSGTLIIGSDRETSNGMTYSIESSLPLRSAAQIERTVASIPESIADRYTQLPADYSQIAADQAMQITADAGATTAFQQALALQDYFLQFDYNLDISNGHANKDIEDFLANREGYCEQFAGTFASMARSLGLPSRVAVGFTWGDAASEPDTFIVRGKHAHAWPEVYLAGAGWVRFEPTPGRGAPGDTAVTGQPPAQDAPVTGSPATTTTTAPGQPSTSRVPSSTPIGEGIPDLPTGPGGAQTPSGTSPWGRIAAIIGAAAAIVVALAALTAGLNFWRRRRGSVVPDGPRGTVARSWLSATQSLTRVGITRRPAETATEYAARASAKMADIADPMDTLADAATSATYGAAEPDESLLASAEEASNTVRVFVTARLTRKQRLLWWVDPRPLLRPLRPSGLGSRQLNEG